MRRFFSLIVCSGFLVLMTLAPQGASAQATFDLRFSGPGQYTPSGFPECPPQNPSCAPEPITWKGTITVVTSDKADGTYSGAGFLSLAVDSNLFSAASDGLNFPSGEPDPGAPASVTLLHGQVTSFDFYYFVPADPGFEQAAFTGMGGTYTLHDLHHGPEVFAIATITNVPEPETLSLMLAGLLLTGVVRRSRKAMRPVKS